MSEFDGNISIFHISKPFQRRINIKYYKKIPIGVPYKLFLFKNYLTTFTKILALFYAIIIRFFIDKKTIIIARSYFPGLVCYFLKIYFGISYIFDPRSLFVHENISAKKIKQSSKVHLFWNFQEKKILSQSNKVIVVSLFQGNYYKSIQNDLKIIRIPCYATKKTIISDTERYNLRKQIGVKKNETLIVYYGSLDSGWNNIKTYSKIFKECVDFNYKVLIISQNYRALLKEPCLKNQSIKILNTSDLNFDQLNKYIQAADFGIIIMKKCLDWKSRLSVKFVEYLNSGVKVIVGQFVGEAARLSNELFKDRTIIYSKKNDLKNLKPLNERLKNSKIFYHFSPANINNIK
tara:strand:- start:90 stop:1133 length:1044 start_codon:yes stop_codon:yes gene_type:complete